MGYYTSWNYIYSYSSYLLIINYYLKITLFKTLSSAVEIISDLQALRCLKDIDPSHARPNITLYKICYLATYILRVTWNDV